MQRLTAALLALVGVLALAGCSDDAGADVKSPRFTRGVLTALEAGGHAPYGTDMRYAHHGETVSVGHRRFPPCSAWTRATYPADGRVLASADGFATDGTRQVYRTITIYPSPAAARRWVAAFLKRGVGCTAIAGTKVMQRLAARPTVLQPDVPVDKFFTRYDGWAGATSSLGSSWSVVARRDAQVTLTTVYVPDVGGDLATMDPVTRDALLAYLGTQNARLVRAAFSHDALRP
jgi:hypothetical protein